MMQWLRDHTKQIMVVVVLLAMLAFIGDQALMNMLSASEANEKYGKVFGETVRTRDLLAVQQDMMILERLGFQLNFSGVKPVTSHHYYMLLAEAKAAGLSASQAEIDQTLKGQGATADVLQMLQPRNLYAPANVYEAVGHYIMINKNAERVIRAAMPSDAEVRHYAVDTEDRAKVKTVVLDASKFVDTAEVIPDAELQAHFDKYKGEFKAENPDGYGYKYPDRVKLQCIVADFSRIASQTTVTQEDASAHWRKNKAAYSISEKVPVSQPATTNPTDTQPAPPSETMISREMTFSEARPQVEAEIKKKRAAQLAEQAMRKASTDLLKPWEVATSDKKTGLKPIPANVADAGHMEAIRNKAAAEAGIALDYMEIGPISKSDLAVHPAVGKAMVPGSDMQRLTLAEYAFRVPPLYKSTDEFDATPRLQRYQTPDAPLPIESMPRYTIQNNQLVQMPGERTGLVLFRVIEAYESAPPATLAEVHAQVLSDLREKRAYERMESAAQQLYAAARKVGLTDALSLDDALKTKLGISAVSTPSPFARKMGGELAPAQVEGIGAAEEFLTTVFSMSAADWTSPEPATALPESPALTTRPAATPAPRVALVNLPKTRKRVVVEFLEMVPLTEDRYTSQVRSSSFQQLFQRRAREAGREWFDTKNIEKRCKFEPLATDPVRTGEGVQDVPAGNSPA